MSYITAMVLCDGIVMAADRQITQSAGMKKINPQTANNTAEQQVIELVNRKLDSINFDKPLTRSAKKLFTIGDNVGVAQGQNMFSSKGLPINMFVDAFCRRNNFVSPKEAAEKLLEYLRTIDSTADTIFMVAGYDKSKPDVLTGDAWHINVRDNECCLMNNPGFSYAGANDYFLEFSNKINDLSKIMNYSLQDGINICKLAIDTSRGLERYIDFNEAISDEIEMIVVTIDGIKWIKKAELVL